MLALTGVQIDSVIVSSLPADIVFDVAIRLVGLPLDFESESEIQVKLSAPDWEEIGVLAAPVSPREPAPSYIAGSEINYHTVVRIDFEATEFGTHHLEFALDDRTEPRVNTALSVVER